MSTSLKASFFAATLVLLIGCVSLIAGAYLLGASFIFSGAVLLWLNWSAQRQNQ